MKSKTKTEKILLPLYVGFMRLITLNFNKWGKPVEEGWKR